MTVHDADLSGPPTSAGARTSERALPLTPGELAWVLSVPVALVTVLLLLVLGPPLGSALLSTGPVSSWRAWGESFQPEPSEQARFLLSLCAPLLLAAALALAARRPPALRPATTTWLVTGVEAGLAVFVVICVIAQWQFVFGPLYSLEDTVSFHRVYFKAPTLVVAAIGTLAIVLAVRSDAVRARYAAWARDTRARRLVAAAVAVLAVALWLSHAFVSEGMTSTANYFVTYHLQFPMDETYAVLDGRTPMVDFVSQYSFLWPYPLALGVWVLGDLVGVWTGMVVVLSGLSMLAMFAVLRRTARSSLTALLLFLPFLAASFFMLEGPLDDRYTFGNYFGNFPMRYAGPFLLAWLLARHLDAAAPRRAWLLFAAAGLVVLNNVDHGVPALGATIAALLWAHGRPSRASLGRLAASTAAGLAIALALVSLLTLVRNGSLPHLGLAVHFSRLFGQSGFAMLPMPTLGLHLVVYLTFVGALGVATVRAIGRNRDRLLTGMLAWSGVFGLGSSAYYVGRSHPESLIATFPMWSFTLALLVLVALRALAARPRRRPQIAELLCVFWFAVLACTWAQVPTPWGQAERIQDTSQARSRLMLGEPFVAANTSPGENVVMLTLLSHRLAYRLDITNVAPYFGSLSMPLREQLDETIEALREAGGRKVFLWRLDTDPGMRTALAEAGFALTVQDRNEGFELWVDRSPR